MQNNRLNSDAIIVLVILIILLYNLCRTKWIENRLWNRSFNWMFSTTSVMRFVFVLNIVTSHVLTVTDKNWARCIFPFLPVNVLRSCTVRLSMSKKDFNRYKAFYLFEYALASVWPICSRSCKGTPCPWGQIIKFWKIFSCLYLPHSQFVCSWIKKKIWNKSFKNNPFLTLNKGTLLPPLYVPHTFG